MDTVFANLFLALLSTTFDSIPMLYQTLIIIFIIDPLSSFYSKPANAVAQLRINNDEHML